MPYPLCSANPKTRQVVDLYLADLSWASFSRSTEIGGGASTEVSLPFLQPSPSPRSISFYLYEGRNKSEFSYVLGVGILGQGREERRVETFHIRTLKCRSIISEIDIKCDKFLTSLRKLFTYIFCTSQSSLY